MKRIIVFFCTLMCVASVCAHTINWKIDNQTYQTTTCNSGDNVTPPSAPSKTGYTFVRWAPLYDFSTLDTSIKGDHSYSRDVPNTCRYDVGNTTCDARFDDLDSYQWKVSFSYGIIYGDALCSITAGNTNRVGIPDETTPDGINCWCRATGYSPDYNNDVSYGPNPPLSWMFRYGFDTASSCADMCAYYCADGVKNQEIIRRPLFGVTQ